MKRFYDTELDTFRAHFAQMGALACEQVSRAMHALAEQNTRLASEVVAGDDALDRLEILMDDEAVRYMNMRAPVATDLRLLIAGIKASQNLERAGDEAVSIARRVTKLSAPATLAHVETILRMGAIAGEMLRDALACLATPEIAANAPAVIRRDDEVDALNKQIYRDLSAEMIARPETISFAPELMFIAKSVERIADHATNIAEEMIYLGEARDIRHARP